mgnify:FL=1
MANISGILGNKADNEYFMQLSEKAKADITKVYFDATNSTYSIGN